MPAVPQMTSRNSCISEIKRFERTHGRDNLFAHAASVAHRGMGDMTSGLARIAGSGFDSQAKGRMERISVVVTLQPALTLRYLSEIVQWPASCLLHWR